MLSISLLFYIVLYLLARKIPLLGRSASFLRSGEGVVWLLCIVLKYAKKLEIYKIVLYLFFYPVRDSMLVKKFMFYSVSARMGRD